MKFPDILKSYLPKKEEKTEYFFSLYLDRDAAAVAAWHLDSTGLPHVDSFAHAVLADDSWEAKIQVVDRLLSAAEDKVGVLKAITKTVFGIPGTYLTDDGNIADEIRPHLKKMSRLLELEPVGFVPLSQAIAFSLKKEEGIPPSVILLGCSGVSAHMSLFRVGQLTHQESFTVTEDPATDVEVIVKKHQDGEVLPSRILLYGGNATKVEDIRSKLLKHPWPTKANFLHFPKIEVISVEPLLTAVSLAGASELAHDLGESPDVAESEDAGEVSTVVAQPTLGKSSEASSLDADDDSEKTESIDDAHLETHGDEADEEVESIEGDSTLEAELVTPAPDQDAEGVTNDDDDSEDNEEDSEEDADDEEELEDGIIEQEPAHDDVANVQMVTPESLGFSDADVLEQPSRLPLNAAAHASTVTQNKARMNVPKFSLPTFSFSGLSTMHEFISKLPKLHGKMLSAIGAVLLLIIIGILMYRTIPRATVTVLVASQTIDESTTLSVDPGATSSDPEKKIVPGKTEEQSLSGEKTAAVSGKKNIGDQAKGSVTIYNKITSSKSLTKGTTLSGGGVAFTLDSDVSVASASESIGSITFGKTTANVTAKEIGTAGNVPSSTEFTFSGISSAQLSARNDAAFTGGTSKQVTVVSRADQDAIVKALTEDLVTKAKQQLQSQTGGAHLIDGTIKTEVTEKVFSAELDEEAKELNGKVTVKVSGISFEDGDIKAALLPRIEQKIPAGYTLAPEQTKIESSNVTVKKDKSISMTAKLQAVALPTIDAESLKKQLAGKDVKTATEILKGTRGVSGAEFRFVMSPTKNRLPYTSGNITISVMVQ